MANPPAKPSPTPTPAPAPAPTPAPAPKPQPPPATTPAGKGPPTNGKKAIITASFWPPDLQLAESSGKPLKYFEKGDAGKVIADDNHIETWKAIPGETCTHTYVKKFLVVHHETKIGNDKGPGPSWYASNGEKLGAPPHGIGVVGKQVQFFAQAVDKSKDVRVEGHWLVREHDKTNQDNANGKGKFVYANGVTEVPDDSDLIFMQCSVSKLRMECKHPEPNSEQQDSAAEAKKLGVADKNAKPKRFVLIDPEAKKVQNVFEVFLGDEVTIWATRVNAAETDAAQKKKPKCDFALYKAKRSPPKEETRHVAFLVSRTNSAVTLPFVCDGWDKKENVTIVGADEADPGDASWTATKIVLGKEWLLEEPGGVKAGKPGSAAGMAQKQATLEAHGTAKEVVQSRSAAGDASYRASRNSSDLAAGEVVSANQRVDRAKEAHAASNQRIQGMKDIQTVGKAAYTGWKTFQAVVQFINWDPLTITLAAHGCSAGLSAIVKAYPKGAAEIDLWALHDLPFKKTVETVKSAVASFKQFLKYIKGANVKGHGTPDEAGTPDDATSASLGPVTIGFYFFRSQKKFSNAPSQAKPGPREDDDMEPVLKLASEWKELTKDVPEKKLESWMVRRAFSLDVGVEKLIGLFFKAEVALLKLSFIGIVAEVLDFFGVKVGPYLSFDIALSVGIVAKFGRDEYGEWFGETGTVPASAKVALTLFIKAGQVAEVGARVSGTWKATYIVRKNEKTQQVCLESDPGQYEVKSELYAKVDIGIWSGEYSKEFYKWTGTTSATSWPFMEFR